MSTHTIIPKKLSVTTTHAGGYRVRYYLGSKQYETSKLTSTTLTAATTEAFEWLERRMSNQDKPKHRIVRLDKLVSQYIDHQRTRMAASEITVHTVNNYRTYLGTLLRWWERNDKPRPNDLPDLYDRGYVAWRMSDYAEQDHKWGDRTKITNKSLIDEVGKHTTFWNWCIKHDYAHKPITLRIKSDPEQRRAEFTFDEIKKITASFRGWLGNRCRNDRERYTRIYLMHLIRVLSHTGLRPIEARNLRFKDVRREDGYALVQVRGKKNTGSVVVPLDVIYYFDRQRTVISENPLHRSTLPMEEQWVFPTVNGDYNKTMYRKCWIQVLKRCDLYKRGDDDRVLSLYSFRHAKISNELRRGVPVYDVAINNRTSVLMVEKTYSHVIAASRADSLLRGLDVERNRQLGKSDWLLDEMKAHYGQT